MKRTLSGIVLLGLACSSANAAVQARAGGQAYYDNVLNITWVADANLAKTSGYDADGLMTWPDALAWIASLNAQNAGLGYLGTNDWRLPTATDTGPAGCDYGFDGTDCGFNVDISTGEMANIYYSTLGNIAAFDTGAALTPCALTIPLYCLTNDGPFLNLQPDGYWSGTEYAAVPGSVWYLDFSSGDKNWSSTIAGYYAWAVRTGDIGDVPFPDLDSDGVADVVDNCTSVANASQCDSDGDGFGNACDGDLNNNGFTNAQDYILFRAQLGQSSVAPTYNQADLNCNGFVNAQDYILFRGRLGTPSGPSGLVP